jgi:hypothetical protein
VVEPIVAWTPTLAVAGADFYSSERIAEWQNSLLVTSLKGGQLTALKLSQDGRTVLQEESHFYYWWGRLRDLCISPDGRLFLAVSNRDGRGTVEAGDDRIVELAAATVSSTYGARESGDLRFSVYPNPFGNDGLQIDYNISEEAILVVYDQVGRELTRRVLYPSETYVKINLSGDAGLYNLLLLSQTGSTYFKAIKL